MEKIYINEKYYMRRGFIRLIFLFEKTKVTKMSGFLLYI